MELRQNWHKFRRTLGCLPPKKSGLVVLHSHQRALAGIQGQVHGQQSNEFFQDTGMALEPFEGSHEVLAHKYNAGSVMFVDSDELLSQLGQVAQVRPGAPATDHFYSQVNMLRERFLEKSVDRQKLAHSFGDRNHDSFWPRSHFFMNWYRSFFGELFPERKLLLLMVVDSSVQFDSILLDFQGAELKGFCEPDFSSVDWRGQDLYLPSTAGRFVAWCESHHLLPTYSLVISRRVWNECRDIQQNQGERAAWRSLQKFKSERDVEREVLFEPDPWPVKALLRWHSFRG
jgi:hypothetical protein